MKRPFFCVAAVAAMCSSQASWTVSNLHPAGGTFSYAVDGNGGQQVGYVGVGGLEHASLWTGTAASWTDLNPANATRSNAFGVGGGQ